MIDVYRETRLFRKEIAQYFTEKPWILKENLIVNLICCPFLNIALFMEIETISILFKISIDYYVFLYQS